MEMSSPQVIKCHKCRQVVIENTCVIDSSSTCDPKTCESYDVKKFIYLSEDLAPTWIKSKVEEEQWTKGKLYCSNCKNRIGAFDYISGRKCVCRATVLPPIYLVTSQVDRPIVLDIT